MTTMDDLRKLKGLAEEYAKVSRVRPIEYHEVNTAPIMDPETGVEWPLALESGYCVLRQRKILSEQGNWRMVQVVAHVAERQDEAVRWAIADAAKEGAS